MNINVKRACVKWGIGRELYTAPFIFVPCEVKEESDGKGGKRRVMAQKISFYVSDIKYNDHKQITYLTINGKCDKEDKTVFKWQVGQKAQTTPAPTLATESVEKKPAPPKNDNANSNSKKYSSKATMTVKEAEAYSLPFGKHKGIPFKDVPVDYLEYIVNKFDDGDAKVAAKIILNDIDKAAEQLAITSEQKKKPTKPTLQPFDDDDDLPF